MGIAGVAKGLLKAGADPGVEGGYFWTVLQAVILLNYQNHEVINILLEGKVDANAVGGDYGIAIQAAASGGNKSLVEKLLRAGQLPAARSCRHENAFQATAGTGNLMLAQLLLETGADPDIGRGIHGRDLLGAVVVSGVEGMVGLLLSNGANFTGLGRDAGPREILST